MAFQLRIARGHQEGRSYLIGQSRVRVGAMQGNDVVLSDAGVSGQHLQIVEREGKYFVSDLASANGTWLNGEPVQTERELKTGDALAVGAALLSFVLVDAEKRLAPLVPVETRDSTVPENVGKRQELTTVPQRLKPKPFADDDATAPVGDALHLRAPLIDPETTAPEARPLGAIVPVADKTLSREAAEPSSPSSPSINSLLLDDSSKESSGGSLPPLEISRSELAALREEAELGDHVAARGRPPVPSSPSPWEPSEPSGHSLSVTPLDDPTKDERFGRHTDALSMRVHRPGLLASLEDLPGWVRIGGAAVFGLLVVLAVALIIRTVRGPSEGVLPPEPSELSKDPIAFSFGVGPKVDFEQVDQKQLTFELPASPAYLVLLHYEAQDIDKQEVEILVNNASAGFVPADTGIDNRLLETVLSPDLLKPGEKNVVMFDNLRNPPGQESWRVSKPSYQLVPLSPLETADQLKSAQQRIDAGNALFSAQKAAPDNLFKAWAAFREGYFTLVGVSTAPGKQLLTAARLKYEEAGLQLDRECARLLAAANKRMEDKLPQEAKKELDQVDVEFTSDDHRCRALASERRDEYLLR